MKLTIDKKIEKLICDLPPCVFKFKYILNRRWPFLYPHRRERVIDIIIMREINKFNINLCDLLDNQDHRKEKLFTVPIINVIESLIFEYGNKEKIFENIYHGLALFNIPRNISLTLKFKYNNFNSMGKGKYPKTNSIRFLETNKIPFEGFFYKYEERGGTRVSARELGVDEHIIVKTIIVEDENKNPYIVLMHGDKEISTKNLARNLNVKSISPCSPETANKHSGYVVGGTSPFGTRKSMPIFIEKSILDLEYIFINGGKKGFLVKIDSKDVQKLLNASLVEVGIDG